MLDALKPLLESGLVNEETRTAINEAWQSKLKEAREDIRVEIREELAGKYEHDKQTMIAAIDKMVTETLTEEVNKIKQEQADAAKYKVGIVKEMRNAAKKFDTYVTRLLAEELAELAADRTIQKENMVKLEKFVMGALAEEIAEFNQDKTHLVETRVRLIRESKEKMANLKAQFVARSSKAVSKIVSETLNHEISQLHNDIKTARQNNFGRKIFEAYASEFGNSLHNENAEIASLKAEISRTNVKLNEAKAEIAAKTKLAESANRNLIVQQEKSRRNSVIAELLSPLDKSKKEVMEQLLENVDTPALRSAYDKYLPSVLDNKVKASTKTSLLTEETGDKQKLVQLDENSLSDLRKLAGLPK